jgi:hypothetical protein
MNFIRKIYFLIFFYSVFLIPFGNYEKEVIFGQQVKDRRIVDFTEVRRLNSTFKLKLSTIIKNTKEIKDLYKNLDDSRHSRSAPIPILKNDKEVFLVLKPKLKKARYGDIEIEKMESDGKILFVTYKEVDNQEYADKKQSNPIVILKVIDKPKGIKLIQIE